MEQPNYFSIITADVRYDKRLKANEKLLYSEITALSNKYGYCSATNRYFADLYGVNPPTVSGWIQDLIKFGYIRKEIKRKENQEVLYRHLFINNLPTKNRGGVPDKNVGPGLQKVKGNNTSLNNTSINKNDDHRSAQNPFDLARLAGINVQSGLNLPIFSDYINRLGNALVCYAIKRTNDKADHPNWSYLQTVLKSLDDHHVKTVKEAEELSAKYRQRKGKSSSMQRERPHYHLPTNDAGLTQTEALQRILAKEAEEDRLKAEQQKKEGKS